MEKVSTEYQEYGQLEHMGHRGLYSTVWCTLPDQAAVYSNKLECGKYDAGQGVLQAQRPFVMVDY